LAPEGGGGYGCNQPDCMGFSGDICLRSITGDYYCTMSEGPLSPCPTNELSYYSREQFGNAYESSLMYDFKDNFLNNSSKGLEYIDNYYSLGKEWSGNLNAELAIQTAVVLTKFNPVMRAFLEPDAHTDEIILTPELSTSLLNLLNSYQTITKSSEGKQILNSIREDIAQFSNLTLGEILFILNNQ
jgi:hypothetical protein